MALVTPAHFPSSERDLERWDALADGLRERGVPGFIEAYGVDSVPPAWRDTMLKVLQQRLAAHTHPGAVADALEQVPRSDPFGAWNELHAIAVPTVVVASGDEADPGHPFAVGERFAAEIPGAELVTEEPGKSPLAWQGGQLSKVIAETAARRKASRTTRSTP